MRHAFERSCSVARSQFRDVATETERTLSVVLGVDAALAPPGPRVMLLTVPGPVFYDVRNDRMTRASAARALGMTLDDFLVAAGQCGLYAIYDVDDLRRELDGIAPRNG